MYDVVIIGAGPAGSTLARLVGSGLRVLLVDRRSLAEEPSAGQPEKLCGGLLAPAAQRELARQGLGVPSAVLEGPQLFAVRTVDHDAGLERLYQRNYLNVDRGRFDRWLAGLVPSSVDRAFGWNAHSLGETADGVEVRFATPGGGSASVLARLVVGADGASSAVRRAFWGSERLPKRYAAVQASFDTWGAEPHYGAVFDAQLTDYYGWTIPKGDALLVGGAFPVGAGVDGRFDVLVDRLRVNGFRIGTERSRRSALVLRPLSPTQLALGRGRVALIGEAAGLISPSSAEGISYALRSAASLAEAVRPGTEGAVVRYRDAVLPVAAEVAAKMLKSRAIHGAAARHAIMASGLGAIAPDAPGHMGAVIGELLTP